MLLFQQPRPCRINMLTVSPEHDVPAPARGDLLDLPRLEELASRLAHTLRVNERRRGSSQHLRDLEKQTELLAAVYQDVAGDVHRSHPISPAAEWLLDNFHLVTNEVRSIHTDLPSRYYKKLPRVVHLSARGPTRIEVLARELITHSDGRLDAERLQGFLRAFQSV